MMHADLLKKCVTAYKLCFFVGNQSDKIACSVSVDRGILYGSISIERMFFVHTRGCFWNTEVKFF